jgi:membrane-associated PAP2 superfamily phosphatase
MNKVSKAYYMGAIVGFIATTLSTLLADAVSHNLFTILMAWVVTIAFIMAGRSIANDLKEDD